MYKIIGADQKEYGPITGDQIRQWIRDGRVNAHTQARLEPGGNWQPLSAFPEFADALQPGVATPGPAAPAFISPVTDGGSREAALQKVKGPAICLIVMSSLGLAIYLFNALAHLVGASSLNGSMTNLPPWLQNYIQLTQGPVGALIDLAAAGLNGLALFGAIKMLRLQSHTLAMVSCILSMLPVASCCCVLGLPFGIWGLVVISKPEVKSQFT